RQSIAIVVPSRGHGVWHSGTRRKSHADVQGTGKPKRTQDIQPVALIVSWNASWIAWWVCIRAPPGSSRSSELFRQEFSVDNFLKPPTVFHTGLMDAPGPQFNGEFRSANVCKYVRSS